MLKLIALWQSLIGRHRPVLERFYPEHSADTQALLAQLRNIKTIAPRHPRAARHAYSALRSSTRNAVISERKVLACAIVVLPAGDAKAASSFLSSSNQSSTMPSIGRSS